MRSLLLALVLAPIAFAAEVSGFVYAPDGNVVEGATVRAGSASVVTNKDGAFALKNVAEGVVELEVVKNGVGAANPLVLSGDVVSITLGDGLQRFSSGNSARGEGTVGGKITLDGKPLANAPVVVGDERVLTNAKGEYKATGLPPGRHVVMVDERLFPRLRSPSSTRMYAEGTEPYIADLRNAREATVNLEMRSAPMIRGRVIGADDKPVARARVQLVLANRSTLDFALDQNATRSMPDGRFSFPAPEWEDNEQVSVAVTPLLQSTIRSKPFVLGSTKGDFEIKLPKLEAVHIRVLDRAGKPVPNARVAFASSDDAATVESFEMLVQEQFAKIAPRTNAEGELAVQLAADSYDFVAVADGFQVATLTRRITKPETVDLTLERAATLRGRVHRGDRGVENANVNILSERIRGGRSSASTDDQGRFEISGLAPGTYTVQVYVQDELIDRRLETQVPGNIDVALPPAGTLRGRVVDAVTAAPVREFVFSVEPADAADSRSPGGVHRGQSSDDGTFTLHLPVGAYRVSAGATGFTPLDPIDFRIVADETTAIELPLGRGATVRGRVIDESGLPIPDADVTVVDADAERMRRQRTARAGPSITQTAIDGTFTLTGVQPGEAQLTVRKPGYVPHRKTIEPDGTPLEVQLSRGLSLSGVVTRTRKPVPGARVTASTPAIGAEGQTTVTDEDGRFTLSGLGAARYTVIALDGEQHTEIRDVDPARQKTLAISLDPEAKGIVYGTVTGIPPAGGKYVRRVVMIHGGDSSAEGPIDDAGNYRVENAPVGTVTVTAVVESSTHAARASQRREIEVLAGQPLRVDIDLGGTVSVSGHVTVEGKPVAGATVGFSSEDGMMGSTETREDGAYEAILPGPGRYHIYARSDQLDERFSQTVRELRGGETIDFDLREQVLEGTVVDAVTHQPIADALVTLAPAAGVAMSIAAEVQTDARGRFRIVTATSGPLRLVAAAYGYAHGTLPVGDSGTPYAFELSPVPDLRVRVLDARTGTPLDAHVIVIDAVGVVNGRPRRSSDGTTYLFSLAPGKYRLMAVVQGYTPRTVDAEAPGAIDIAVE